MFSKPVSGHYSNRTKSRPVLFPKYLKVYSIKSFRFMESNSFPIRAEQSGVNASTMSLAALLLVFVN